MMGNRNLRHRWRAQLQALVNSVPEIKHALLASGGGVVVAWPSRPVLRIVGLAATTPEVLELLAQLHRAGDPIRNEQLGGTTVRLRSGLLLTAPVDSELSLKLLFAPMAETDRYVRRIVNVVAEIRMIAEPA